MNVRRLVEKHVVRNPKAQRIGIRAVRGLRRLKARCWSLYRTVTKEGTNIDNVYIATVQKTGSQWINAVLKDPVVRRRSGLGVYPGHRYEWDEFHSSFPRYLFVPNLYISYGSYEEIRKPPNYKAVYVLRDPRDIVVSWYYSMRYSHRLMGKVTRHRKVLETKNKSEGLAYCIKALALKMTFMRTWLYHKDDDRILFVRFEELTDNPVTEFMKIFEHCCIDIDEEELSKLLGRYTKDKMRDRDQRRSRLTKRSIASVDHYREEGSNWQSEFEERHLELFDRVNGNLLTLAGYRE